MTPETLKAQGPDPLDPQGREAARRRRARRRSSTITVHGASATAREKVEAAGGTLTLLREPKVRKVRKHKAAPARSRPRPTSRAPRRPRPPSRAEPSPRARSSALLSWLANAWRVPELRRRVLFTAVDPRDVPPRLVDARAGRRLGHDPELLQRPGRQRPRPAQPLQRLGALALLALRARDHAVRHGLDHPPAPDGRRADARAAAEGGRGRLRQDQPVHALPHGRARGGAERRLRVPLRAPGRAAASTPAASS